MIHTDKDSDALVIAMNNPEQNENNDNLQKGVAVITGERCDRK